MVGSQNTLFRYSLQGVYDENKDLPDEPPMTWLDLAAYRFFEEYQYLPERSKVLLKGFVFCFPPEIVLELLDVGWEGNFIWYDKKEGRPLHRLRTDLEKLANTKSGAASGRSLTKYQVMSGLLSVLKIFYDAQIVNKKPNELGEWNSHTFRGIGHILDDFSKQFCPDSLKGTRLLAHAEDVHRLARRILVDLVNPALLRLEEAVGDSSALNSLFEADHHPSFPATPRVENLFEEAGTTNAGISKAFSNKYIDITSGDCTRDELVEHVADIGLLGFRSAEIMMMSPDELQEQHKNSQESAQSRAASLSKDSNMASLGLVSRRYHKLFLSQYLSNNGVFTSSVG